MGEQLIYQEKVSSSWITLILALIAAVFLVMFVYQVTTGPIGKRPAPNWFLFIMFVLFVALTFNFSHINIKITPEHITVSYGIASRRLRWSDINDCYIDDVPAISYGGWGIRIAKVRGKLRLVYNTIGGPRVVLSLSKGKINEFVFSTKNPEVIISMIKQKISESKLQENGKHS